MLGGIHLRSWGLLAVPLILAACNLPVSADPTATPTPKPLTLDEIETAVVATLEAEAQMTASAKPSDTPVPAQPTSTASDTPAGPTETPTDVPICLVVSNALNLRYGPGLVYAPPLQTLTAGTVLHPFAKNADGSWLEIQLQGEPTTGWVSSGGQYVSCNFDPSGLPLGQIPPTPTPTITPTPAPTFTPSPTDRPTSAPTTCPNLNKTTLNASEELVKGKWVINLAWGSVGGCGPITGTITATFSDQRAPYATYSVKGGSGKLTEIPLERSPGTYTIEYILKIEDSTGQTDTASAKVPVYWIG